MNALGKTSLIELKRASMKKERAALPTRLSINLWEVRYRIAVCSSGAVPVWNRASTM
jgi:hypothetical protein